VARHQLPAGAVSALAALLDGLATDAAAPTTVRSPARAVDVHLADSLIALDLAPVRQARLMVDIGAGAGFPGLALAVALPDTTVRLVESVAKKCAFMTRTAVRAGIRNAAAVHARAEALGAESPQADLVTARAVGRLALVAEYAAPMLAVGGHLVAWTGRRDPDQEVEAARVAPELGLELIEIRPVTPYPAARHRHLHVYRKSSPTSDRFPRRPGIARKRSRSRSRTAAKAQADPRGRRTGDGDRR
jgi:16S rRNA (guanine527-N7)-methyltransferase